MTLVVDASVILAYFLGEPGGEILGQADARFILSSVNLCEVLTRIVDRGLSIDDTSSALKILPIDHVTYGVDDARQAAALRAETRHLGLSLGDRACLALGLRLGMPVLTADTAWAALRPAFDIRLIR